MNLTGSSNWRSTGWRIAATPGAYTCASTTARTTPGTYTESFTLTAPASGGTYNAYFAIFSNAGCGGAADATTSLTNAVVVTAKQDQAITFDPLADKRPDQMPVTVSATASSNLPVTFSSGTPSVCTVSGTTVNFVANGTCTVRADQAGDATYNAAPQMSRSFTIAKGNQAISFGGLAGKWVADPDFTVTATASSGLAVTFSTGTSSVCTVTSAGIVHLVATGTCTIDANQAGNANWNAASQVAQSFSVTKANTTTTVACPADPFTYTGAPQTPCTASATGPGGLNQVLGVSYLNNTNAGTATASAGFAGDANYNSSSDSETFTIDKAASTTTVTCPASVTYTGAPQTPCSAVATGPGGLNQVLAVGYTDNVNAGTATAVAAFAGDANHDASNDSKTFTIDGADQATLSITGPASRTFGDAPFAPTTSGGDGSGATTFTSSTPSVCTAFGSATVTIVAAGTCTVTATRAASGNYNEATSAPFDITIDKADPDCTISGWTGTYDGSAHGASGSCVGVDGTTVLAGLDLGASFTNVPGGTANWAFTDTTGNYNNANGAVGIVIGKAASTTTVTCTAGAPFTYTGSAQTPCTAQATGVGMAPVDVTASLVYADNTNAGTATADATWAGDVNHTGSTGSGNFAIGKADTTTTVDCTVGAPFTYDGTAQTPCTASVTGPGGLNQVLAVGYTDNVNAGTAMAVAAFAGDANHNPSNDSETFTIDKAASTTTVTCPASVTYTGAPQTPCSAVATGPGGLNQVLAVGYTDNVNAGTATAVAAFAGDANHDASNDSKTFTIDGADQATLSITGPASRTFGDAPFAPTTSGGDGSGATTFTSSTPSVCTAFGSATVTIVAAGTCTVTATRAASGNYNEATSAPFDITIDKADTTTTVTCPAGPFTYTGMAQTPCTASATGPGGLNQALTVGYTSNTNAGTATASATFAETANYKSSSDSTTFDIGKADPVCAITGWTGTYDGTAHGASGTCKGVMGETLAGLNLGSTFTNVPGGIANWTYTGGTANYGPANGSAATGNYNNANGAVDIVITKATAVCAITGWTGTYTATSHGASGSCKGVMGETLAGLNLGTLFTNVPGGTASWVFTDGTGNYNDANGSADIVITKATAVCTITGWTGPYDGTSHGASGTCEGVGGEAAGTLDLGLKFADIPGGTATWTFTGNGNYKDQSGDVNIVIEQIAQAITFPALPDITTNTRTVTLAATTSSGLLVTYRALTPMVCTVSGNTVTIVGTGTCTIEASQPGDATHAPADPALQSFTVASATTPPTSTGPLAGMPGSGTQSPLLLLPALAGLMALVTMLLGFRARARRERGAWD